MKIIPWDGHHPISKSGVYSKIPLEAYHSGRLCAGPSISSTGLRTIMLKSLAHYWDLSPYNPNGAEDEKEKEAFILGRATHHLLLGEPFFHAQFVVRPEEAPDGRPWNGNNKTCKAWLAAQRAAGRTVVTADQGERIKGMALALAKEPLVAAGALNGLIEQTIVALDEETGVWVLSRPDVIPTDSGDFVDLKTTTSVIYADLVKTIGAYGYHMQAALCADGYRAAVGQPIASFSFYFIESKRPHCSRMVTIKPADLELGSRQNRMALRLFVDAMNTGVWPGPGGIQATTEYIDLSPRAREAAEAQLKALGT